MALNTLAFSPPFSKFYQADSSYAVSLNDARIHSCFRDGYDFLPLPWAVEHRAGKNLPIFALS